MPRSTLFHVPPAPSLTEFKTMPAATPPVWQPFGFRRRAMPIHHAPPPQISASFSSAIPIGQQASHVTSGGEVTGASVGDVAATDAGAGGAKEFHCDSCEKDFPHARGMQQHLKTHVQCPQCPFSATQSFLNAHIISAHTTGSRWTYDAADIAKWRAERRKRYPTESNVQKRKRDDDDRESRGQTASTPQFRMGKGHYRDTKPRTSKAPQSPHNHTDSVSSTCCDNVDGSTSAAVVGAAANDDQQTNPYIATLQSLCSAENVGGASVGDRSTPRAANDDDDADDGNASTSAHTGGGLVEYSSSDDDDECTSAVVSPVMTLDTAHIPTSSTTGSTADLNTGCTSDTSRSGHLDSIGEEDEAPTELSSRKAAASSTAQHHDVAQFNQIEQGLEDPAKLLRPKKYHNSLLERLLAKEIRHERNTVLQCIRYIVRNNFFDMQ